MSAFQSPKGTKDTLAPESARWSELIGRFAARSARAGFGLVISPVFEDVEVFRRSAGESSDVVQKEMYEFDDKGGRRIALRPEGTASIVRAYVQHRPVLPFKASYVAPMFRYEAPQAGRFRQHHQLGVETIGTADPAADVEVIDLLCGLYRELGLLDHLTLRVNSLGDETCAPEYREALGAYLEAHQHELCDEHRARWATNPLRILDCKRSACGEVREGAPRLRDALCDDCRAHFTAVAGGLDRLGVAFERDDFLVRGLDYYTRTTFEFASPTTEGVGGGGRYDGLVEALGGPALAGVGFGAGIERTLLACDEAGVFQLGAELDLGLDAFVVDLTASDEATPLVRELREAGLRVERAFDGRSMKAQLKAADRSGARVAVIIGDAELAAETAVVRPLRSASAPEQATVARCDLVRQVQATKEAT
jgi:histidyl-tRNA synthetase